MSSPNALERGREAFRHRRWSEAFTELSASEAESPLAPADYETLVVAEYLLSSDAGGVDTWERAHRVLLSRGDTERAARCTFWLAMNLTDRGEAARGAGWVSRGRRLLEEANLDCAARGYLLVPAAIQAVLAGDVATAMAIAEEAIQIGQRFHDHDLVAMVRHGQGRMLLQSGRMAEGLALIDEVMVAINSTDVSPMMVGVIYCGVVDALHGVYDTARANEWTAALLRWCEAQPDLVMYRGRCMVHRAEALQMHGNWPAALEQSTQATSRFLGPPAHPAAGAAFYQAAELHRLRGEFEKAQLAYNRGAEFGHNPQPGLAQLGLAQGRVDAAEAAIRRVSGETVAPLARAAMLPAFVDIVLAADDVPAAREAAAELRRIADAVGSEYLRGAAAEATGASLLAEGDAAGALLELRNAAMAWQRLDAPYQAARVRLNIGLACRDLGDEDAAKMEIEAARQAFSELGAAPDLARLESLSAPPRPLAAGGLTGREVQLLALLATGRTNRELAAQLVISEKTVARHVSNIFNKLGVSSRAAATAYAFKHDLA
ncbi:MAG TPA: LuxR C-terminal-related transcriptional regulator [Candidatus Dormibacteraeota bacterium]|nr:LuxR C-terminal-related transcriptional regulator [Candidatus Dormibacteraeota bacterium]